LSTGRATSALRFLDPRVLALFCALVLFRLLPEDFTACWHLMVHHVAQLVDRGQVPTALEASMAKCVAADTAMRVATVAVQISGGTNRIQRVIMARAARGVVLSAPRVDGSRWSAFAHSDRSDLLRLAECEIVRT
jgi:alkylation response protein AidB-like acyl-CoA dehydrogenase